MTLQLVINNKLCKLPDFLPLRGWEIDKKRKRHGHGYLRYKSRARRKTTTKGVKRGTRAHRAVMEKLLGRPLTDDEHVHHQDFDKLNCCGCNLILLSYHFNPSPRRDPYTGERMSQAEFDKRYGYERTHGYAC